MALWFTCGIVKTHIVSSKKKYRFFKIRSISFRDIENFIFFLKSKILKKVNWIISILTDLNAINYQLNYLSVVEYQLFLSKNIDKCRRMSEQCARAAAYIINERDICHRTLGDLQGKFGVTRSLVTKL